MNSSIALRLLWKEYRVQRGLWLSMAGGCIALQALIAYLVQSEQESFQGTLPVAFMLTGFYAIGSGAITFSIEREEGTQLRPVMLGCPPGLTLTIKTIFGIVATTLLLAITLSSGMLMTLGNLTPPENTLRPDAQGMIIPLALLFVALPYFGCLLWSTFFSLLTRKVIVALGLAAVAMIVSYTMVAMTSIAILDTGQRRYPQQLNAQGLFLAALVPCVLALLVLTVNYLLTHRWLTRAFFDQSSSKSPSFFKRWRIRQSGLDGSMVVEIGVEDRTAFEIVSAEVAVHQPPPRLGLRMLHEMWWPDLCRHLRFLRWKEAIETRKLFVGFLLAAMVLTTWCVVEQGHGTNWHGPIAFLIHAACVACGAMAFRAEQDERKVQRLADMGLRPATVWLSKHVVWLVRAVISVVAILFCVLFLEWLYSHVSSRMVVGEFIDATWLNTQLPNSMPGYDSGIRLVGRAIILMLTMYGVGQVCSQLIRSTIVSMFVAFILGLTAFGWAGVCFWFNVPFIISVLPLAIGCLLVTWCRTSSWMIDDNRGRSWLWPTATITASIAIIYFGTGLFRVYEIPWSKPFFSDESSAEFDDGLTDEQRASVGAAVTDEELATLSLYQRAAELLGKNEFYFVNDENPPATERWDSLSEGDRQAAEQAIELAIQASASPACAEFCPATSDIVASATSDPHERFRKASKLLLFDAERALEAGRPDDALARVQSAFAVCRHDAGRGEEFRWWSSHIRTNLVLKQLQKWGAHFDLDAEFVDKATQIVDEHRRQMLPVEVANYASAIMIRNTFDADTFTLTELVGNSHELLPLMLATKFPGELARSHRLLNAMESIDVKHVSDYRRQRLAAESGDGVGMSQWYQHATTDGTELKHILSSFVRSTPLLAMIASGPARDQLCLQDIRTECQVRATKIVLRMLLEQRDTGKLPTTLDGFAESLNDPWSDKPFIWYPEGLHGNLMLQSRVKVEAGTPFLITTGQRQFTIRRVEVWAGKGPGGFSQMDGDGGVEGLGSGLADGASAIATDELGAQVEGVPREGTGALGNQFTEKPIRVDYVVDGWDLQPSRPDIVIWELPRNAAAKGETPASDETE